MKRAQAKFALFHLTRDRLKAPWSNRLGVPVYGSITRFPHPYCTDALIAYALHGRYVTCTIGKR